MERSTTYCASFLMAVLYVVCQVKNAKKWRKIRKFWP